MGDLVIISGSSSGGKSTLLEALFWRGEIVVEEPGRRIVAEELENGGEALPWVDALAFIRRAVQRSLDDLRSIDPHARRVIFDRGIIDAAIGLEFLTGEPIESTLHGLPRFHQCVFLAPPWRQIYRLDEERQHSFGQAKVEYDRLRTGFTRLGYKTVILPKASVDERADLVLRLIGRS